MNQILISEKVYVTPELKRKKRMYKIDFFISVFLVFILSSYYIYAEYDKNKNEAMSQEVLSSLSFNSDLVDDTTIKFEDNATIVILNEEDTAQVIISSTIPEENDSELQQQISENIQRNTYRTESGEEYYYLAKIKIPSINCEYGIINTWSNELLKISPCYYWGAQPNKPGNFCVVGHNYRNNKFFSKVPDLSNGDIVEITDLTNKTVQYSVYDKYIVDPNDTACTTQNTNGNTEITIITCTNNGENRVIVKARAIEG